MNAKRFCILLTVVAAFVAGSTTASAQKSGAAVVDVRKIYDNLREWNQAKAEIQTMADLVKQEDQRRQQKLLELQQDLGIILRTDPNFDRKQEEYERAALDRNVWLAYQQAKLGREEVMRMEHIYNKMVDVSKRVALAAGYNMVLIKEQPLKLLQPQEQITKREQLWDKIDARKIIWAADELDLTEQVRTKMDNEFTSGVGK
ncbi:MAG: OmpH family outer membrane protein [Phycisphaeraceae bacterium]